MVLFLTRSMYGIETLRDPVGVRGVGWCNETGALPRPGDARPRWGRVRWAWADAMKPGRCPGLGMRDPVGVGGVGWCDETGALPRPGDARPRWGRGKNAA